MKISHDLADFLFRGLFCLIFIGLGAEHIFSDDLIQHLMPSWVPYPRVISILVGIWLVLCGSLILLGWHLKIAAIGLGLFLILVTLFVHLPQVIITPLSLPNECSWVWTILQRSNLVKNLCLLGVCFQLLHHQVGRFSLDHYTNRV